MAGTYVYRECLPGEHSCDHAHCPNVGEVPLTYLEWLVEEARRFVVTEERAQYDELDMEEEDGNGQGEEDW